jgi:hypothetical protein
MPRKLGTMTPDVPKLENLWADRESCISFSLTTFSLNPYYDIVRTLRF